MKAKYFYHFLSAKSVIDGGMTLGEMLAVAVYDRSVEQPDRTNDRICTEANRTYGIGMDQAQQDPCCKRNEDSHISFCMNYLPHLPPTWWVESQLINFRQTGNLLAGMWLNKQRPWLKRLQKRSALVNTTAAIHFQNASLRTYTEFAGNEPVLRDINLTIPRGKTSAIVKLIVKWKAKQLKLLLKFYEPQKGDQPTPPHYRMSVIKHGAAIVVR